MILIKMDAKIVLKQTLHIHSSTFRCMLNSFQLTISEDISELG